MKPAAFDYILVEHIDEAAALLADIGEDARILAGGQSLIAMLNMRLAKPQALIDIMHASDLPEFSVKDREITVPATLTQAALLGHANIAGSSLLSQTLPWVGHPQTRARGTICGSLAHADPSAELPLALMALQGRVRLRSAAGVREVAADDFFKGMMLTDCQPDELIEAAVFPVGGRAAFAEVGRRKGDFAIVACAAIQSGRKTRLAVGGVNDTPAIRDWDDLDEAEIDDALAEFAASLDAREDLQATAQYRRRLVRKLGYKTIVEARKCVV